MVRKKRVVENKIEEKKSSNKFKVNPWMYTTLVLGVLVLVLASIVLFSGSISKTKAGNSILELAQQQLGDAVILKNVEEYGDNFYVVTLSYQGQDSDIFVTKDGIDLAAGVTPLATLTEAEEETAPTTQQATQEIVKSDKPLVQLFVMTHCPYGTQAEKGFLPLMALFGQENLEIRFVHYFLHEPENAETPIQVCIREEQSDKFVPYLQCFLEEGNTAGCLVEANVDENKVNECIESGRAEEYYNEDSALSEAAGVRGSPSLVVNGQIVENQGRSEQAYADTYCKSFNVAPESCGTVEWNTASPAPGFGYGTTSTTTASC